MKNQKIPRIRKKNMILSNCVMTGLDGWDISQKGQNFQFSLISFSSVKLEGRCFQDKPRSLCLYWDNGTNNISRITNNIKQFLNQ